MVNNESSWCFPFVIQPTARSLSSLSCNLLITGKFTVTKDVSSLTKASFLNGVGKTTPIFCRLSTVTYGVSYRRLSLPPCLHTPLYGDMIADVQREYPDVARNPRGFAVKFYTDVSPSCPAEPFLLCSSIETAPDHQEGNYDMVGLNWPVFFIRDPMQGPSNIRSQQRNPQNFLLDFSE